MLNYFGSHSYCLRAIITWFENFGDNLDCDYNGDLVANFVVRSTLIDQIRDNHMKDNDLVKEVEKIMNDELGKDFVII